MIWHESSVYLEEDLLCRQSRLHGEGVCVCVKELLAFNWPTAGLPSPIWHLSHLSHGCGDGSFPSPLPFPF